MYERNEKIGYLKKTIFLHYYHLNEKHLHYENHHHHVNHLHLCHLHHLYQLGLILMVL
jgi:hypothetical protein